MPLAKVKIGVSPTDFNGISVLASAVIAGMTANPVNFPAPNPSLVTLTAALASLNTAITNWGLVGNRGSHSDWLALSAAAMIMRNDLLLESAYVDNLVDPNTPYGDQVAFIVSSGFSVRDLPTPQGVLNAPQDLHRNMSNSISENDIQLRWKKPLGLTSPGNVKFYKVLEDGVEIANPTKTSITLSGRVHGTTYTYTVIACNDDGDGAISMDLIVNF
jgi:hypothetical protein